MPPCYFACTNQFTNVRGCPFVKFWFNGSFTESYKIKQGLLICQIKAPIFVFYCGLKLFWKILIKCRKAYFFWISGLILFSQLVSKRQIQAKLRPNTAK